MLPAVGLALYYHEIWWLFYSFGAIISIWGLIDLLFDKRRGLFSMSNYEFDGVRCFVNIISNIASWTIGMCLTETFIDGYVLGNFFSLHTYMILLLSGKTFLV